MGVPVQLQQHVETVKQREFYSDFLQGWEAYETWEAAKVGERAPALRTFTIRQEDIVAYNVACGETDPLMVDIEYAKKNSPTGEVLQHPIFVTAIGFYSIGEKGIGTWIRTPGARNPHQRIEIAEPFRDGEVITTMVTTWDKFIQRGKPYIQMRLEFFNEKNTLKGIWWCSLILPKTRADVERFVKA